MTIVRSVGGVPIRFTEERLHHVERRHPEMAGEQARILETLAQPDFVQEGDASTLVALRHYPKTPLAEKHCAVVYKEVSKTDGFVVTAYFTRRASTLRRVVWKR
ncbi:MAG: hypothetical protein AAB152_15580 [Candidatus Coatesbacteria bacterium]